MSVRGWVFVAMLMSVAVLVKPALKVAWPPAQDPAISDDTGTVADGSDAAGSGEPATTTVAGPTTAVLDREPTGATKPVSQDQGEGQQQLASDDEASPKSQGGPAQSDVQAAASPDATDVPPAESSTLQSEMADFTRSIARDYAARRERALLSPSVAATSVPLDSDEARQAQQRAIDDARRTSSAMVADAEDKLGAEQKRTSTLAEQLANVQGQLAAAQTTVGQLRETVASAESRVDDWHRAADQAQAEVTDAKAALVKASAEVSDTKEALGRSKAENADGLSALTQLRSEAADTASRQMDLDRAAAARVEEVQHQLAAETMRAADLTRGLDAARAQMADADRQKTADAEERRTLEAVSKDLDAKLQDERKKGAALAAELATAQATVRQLQEQAKSLQAAAAKPSQPARVRKPDQRGTPEAQLTPAKPAVRTSSPSGAVLPRSQDARLEEKTSAPEGSKTDHVAGKAHRPGEVIAYIPETVRDEGFTSDDYSPYDASDHTVYVDEYVSSPKTKSRRSEVRVAKRSIDLR